MGPRGLKVDIILGEKSYNWVTLSRQHDVPMRCTSCRILKLEKLEIKVWFFYRKCKCYQITLSKRRLLLMIMKIILCLVLGRVNPLIWMFLQLLFFCSLNATARGGENAQSHIFFTLTEHLCHLCKINIFSYLENTCLGLSYGPYTKTTFT